MQSNCMFKLRVLKIYQPELASRIRLPANVYRVRSVELRELLVKKPFSRPLKSSG